MIDRIHKLSVSRQAKLLNISRGAVYYLSKPVHPDNLAIMNAVDVLRLDHAFMGSRQQLTVRKLPDSRKNLSVSFGR